jgi:hypothetical protein
MPKETIGTRLAIALKRKYPTPEAALAALGMDPVLLVQDHDISEDNLAKAFAFLNDKLEPDELEEVKRLLMGRTAEGSQYPQEEAEKTKEERQTAKDRVTTLPRPGGKMAAMDSKPRESYETRFPGAARIRVMN